MSSLSVCNDRGVQRDVENRKSGTGSFRVVLAVAVSCLCLAVCAAGLVAGICVQRLKQQRLVQAANVMRARTETGDANAQFDLASMYFYGKGVPQDNAEAARWYKRFSTTAAWYRTAGRERWRIWVWLEPMLCKRRPHSERTLMPPAFGHLRLTRISSSCGRTPILTFPF